MTHEEFHKLPFRMVSHMSLDTEHLAAYKAETQKGNIVIHTCTRRLRKGEFGKSSRTYIFRNEEYKSVDELLEDYDGTE